LAKSDEKAKDKERRNVRGDRDPASSGAIIPSGKADEDWQRGDRSDDDPKGDEVVELLMQ
jgi:hypothetical protein